MIRDSTARDSRDSTIRAVARVDDQVGLRFAALGPMRVMSDARRAAGAPVR